MTDEKRMTAAGIESAAGIIGCEPALLDALFRVEAPMGGFDAAGRLTILPEKHKIYLYLNDANRRYALRRGLVVKRWRKSRQYRGFGSYRRDSKKAGLSRWHYLEQMGRLDKEAAYLGTSWGLGQVMGFNFAGCGYVSVFQMVEDFQKSENKQIAAVARWVVRKRSLREAFVDRDFLAIATYYNGTGQPEFYAAQIEEKYHESTLRKFIRYEDRALKRKQALRLGVSGAHVSDLQQRLKDLGYNCDVDGIFGERTEDQVILFQRNNGLDTDGVVGELTRKALQVAQPLDANVRPVSDIIQQNGQAGASMGQIIFGAAAGLSGGASAIGSVHSVSGGAAVPVKALDVTFGLTLDQALEATEKSSRLISHVPKLIEFVSTYGLLLLGISVLGFGLYSLWKTVKNYRARRWA